MFSFIEWLVEREILECNQFLFEAATRTKVVSFPKLEMVIIGAISTHPLFPARELWARGHAPLLKKPAIATHR